MLKRLTVYDPLRCLQKPENGNVISMFSILFSFEHHAAHESYESFNLHEMWMKLSGAWSSLSWINQGVLNIFIKGQKETILLNISSEYILLVFKYSIVET